MSETAKPFCPECSEHEPAGLDRRGFMQVVGERTAALLAVGGLAAHAAPGARAADVAKPKLAVSPDKSAEALVRELHTTLSADQKKELVLPWNHMGENGIPTRLGMYNRPILNKTIGDSYTKPQ